MPTLFAAPCDNITDVSRIQIVGDLLGLTVLIDGQPADPDNDGFIVVEPGLHTWTVLSGETVIASGEINVPACFAAATPTPTPTPSATPTPTPSPTPEDSVGGATDDPTLPPTDTFSGGGTMAPTTDSWRILLVVMAGILASLLILTPSPATRRR